MICLHSYVFVFVLVYVFASFDVGMGVSVQQDFIFQCDKYQLAGLLAVFLSCFVTAKSHKKSIGKTKSVVLPVYRRMCQYNI